MSSRAEGLFAKWKTGSLTALDKLIDDKGRESHR